MNACFESSLDMEIEDGLASITQEETGHGQPSSLKVPPFTPTHHLRDRFLSFTEFLLGNLQEWSSPQPPWLPPPPTIAFSGSDRFIKGRLPHRTMAISASLSSLASDAMPLSDACMLWDVHADPDDTLGKMQDVSPDDTLSQIHDTTQGEDESAPAAHRHINDHSVPASNLHCHCSIHDLSCCMRLQAGDSLQNLSSNGSTDNALDVDTDCVPLQDDRSVRGQSQNEVIDLAACRTDISLEIDKCAPPQNEFVQGLSSNEAVDVAACGTDNYTDRVYGHDDGPVLPFRETVIEERLLSMQLDGFDRNVSAAELLDGFVHIDDKDAEAGHCLPFECKSCLKGGNVATDTPEDTEVGHFLPLECKSSLLPSFTIDSDGLPVSSPSKIHNGNRLQSTDVEAPVTLEVGFVNEQVDDLEEGELSERLPDNEYPYTLEERNVRGEVVTQEADPLDASRLEPKALEFTTDDEMDQPISLFVSRYCTRSSFNPSSRKPSLLNTNNKPKKKRKARKKRRTEEQEQVLQEVVSADAGITSQSRQVKGVQKGSGKVAGTGAKKSRQQLSIKKGGELLDAQNGLSELSIGSKVATDEAREGVKKYVELGAAGHQVMESSAVVLSAHPIKVRAGGASCTPGKQLGQHGLAGSKQAAVPEKHKGFLSMVVEEDLCLSTIDARDDQNLASQKTEEASKKPKRTLTVERKKKRQQAKHRKRDKRQDALGIRKLKLKPFVEKKMEREIKICLFYVKGKCSKGAGCTFSHDITPTTKSEMCKYFIKNCCLRGDDCPYSHTLSSFPCKYFHTRGYCLEGDSCRFSHEPISEEAKLELHRKIEQEQQVRQGIVNDGLGHVDSKHSMPLYNSKLRSNPVDRTAEVPVKVNDSAANSLSSVRVEKGHLSKLSKVGKADVSDNPILIKKAASTFTVVPTKAANFDANRSLFCGDSLDTRGPLPGKSSDKSTTPTTQSIERECGGQLEPRPTLAMGFSGNSFLVQDRKTRIDSFLQTQLDDSRLMAKSKLATGLENAGGCYSLSDHPRVLRGQTSLWNMPSMSVPNDLNTKAMGSFRTSSDQSQLIANVNPLTRTDLSPNAGFSIGHQEGVSNGRLVGRDAAVSRPSVLAPTFLDLISKSQEAAAPKWPISTSGLLSVKTVAAPKRSTADKILDRFL